MLSDPFPIRPFTKSLAGPRVALPGSKSITNRALVMAALCAGGVRLEGALFSRDTRIMCDALLALGFEVDADEAARSITVRGLGGEIPQASTDIHVGNAGTAARFLTAFVCLREGGEYRFDGDEAMRSRPVRGLTDALAKLGAQFAFHGQDGHFPFTVSTSGLGGGNLEIDATASSQILSAVLMVAPYAREQVTLFPGNVRPAFVHMTASMMEQFGVDADANDLDTPLQVTPGQRYRCETGCYAVEPDATAASYFVALPLAVGGELEIPGMRGASLQGDVAFVSVMEQLGLKVSRDDGLWYVSFGGSVPDVPINENFNFFSDTFLTLAALSPLLKAPVRITGIAHTRKQETDRVAGMAAELSRLGQRVIEEEGALEIRPDIEALRAIARAGRESGSLPTVETYEDHRFAMSFGVLGSHDLLGDGEPWLQVKDPGCCGKTFPEFFEVLDNLRSGLAE